MKIRNIFGEIRTGKYIEGNITSNESMEVYTFKKEAINYSTLVVNLNIVLYIIKLKINI